MKPLLQSLSCVLLTRHTLAVLWLGVAIPVARAQTASPFASGVWCGNVTSSGASVVSRLVAPGQQVRLEVSGDATLAAPLFSTAATTAAAGGNTVTLSIQGLQPDTDYFYGIELAGILSTEARTRGRFHTFPVGPASFKIAFASCSDFHVADQSAFDAIVAEHPLLFIHTGDLDYNDINSTRVADYRESYDSVLNQPNESALYRSVALAYMWDDHDFCGDNSDRTALGRTAALTAYRERAPHYPLSANAGETIAQSFTVGRVRVIMTDLRSAADPASDPESATKTRLGMAQKAWFKQELLSAHDAGFPLILWVNTTAWIDRAGRDDDSWGSWSTERTELADFIKDNRVANIVILAGDMHALAYDNGTHSDYATGGGAPMPVLQAASLTMPGEIKGGPYTAGPIIGPDHYGVLEIYDTGGPAIACRFLGMKAGEGPKLSYTFPTSAVATTTLYPGGLGGVPAKAAGSAASPSGQFANVSARAQAGTDAASLIDGFVVTGPKGATQQVLVRGVGPALSEFGVAGALAQPVLSVFDSAGKLVATNSGWSTSANAATISAAAASVGAFHLAAGSADSALLLSLAPGAYTLQVAGLGQSNGIALGEMYKVAVSNAQIVNVSCRAPVGTGANLLIAGFVITSGPASVLVRGDGPALAQFGVANFLPQPTLQVFDSLGGLVATNTGWGANATAPQLAAAAKAVEAFPLAAASADSALLLFLPPGAYTIQISGVGGTTGTALAEAYLMP